MVNEKDGKTSRRILLVDDETDLLDSVEISLQELGHQIFKANDGQKAISLLQNERVDAVLSDIRMPNLGGIEILRELRSNQNETPVVFMTGSSDGGLVLEALRLGAFDFLQKPFDYDEMLAVMKSATATGSIRRNLEESLSTVLNRSPGNDVVRLLREKKFATMLQFMNASRLRSAK